jgi:cytosine/adenosine deaminase-related metal-dependent hydrolase
MEHCEIIVSGGWLVDPHDGMREDLALAVQGNRIAAVGPGAEIDSRYHSDRHLDATDRIVLPGLINAHTHASATLFRGYAPDVAGQAFFDRLWRIEALLNDEDVYVGALAGCLEMIRNGVTGFANRKMNRGQGIADLIRLQGAGINVCLGTDGSASDNLDVLMAMKVTHIAQNHLHQRVCALPPESILAMATTNGARALSWEMGRLAPGQLADFVLIDANRPHLRPLITKPRSNVVFNLVYYATGAEVDTVVIDGKVVMEHRQVLTVDENEILRRLQQRAQSLWDRAARRDPAHA